MLDVDAQGVLDLMFQRIWIMYCFHVVSTPRTFALSTHPYRRLRADDERAGALTNIWGPDAASLVTVPHGMDGVVAMEGCTSALWRSSRRFNPGFEIQKKEAESGTAFASAARAGTGPPPAGRAGAPGRRRDRRGRHLDP